MGRITRARDRRLGREVALKEVLAPELRARFEREAMIQIQNSAVIDATHALTGGFDRALRIATVSGLPAVSLWDSAKGRLIAQLPAGEPLACVEFLDDDHVVVGGKTGRLEILDVSERRSGPPLTGSEVIRRVGDSPRWHVENGRVVERQ
jgi:hypothetical protein